MGNEVLGLEFAVRSLPGHVPGFLLTKRNEAGPNGTKQNPQPLVRAEEIGLNAGMAATITPAAPAAADAPKPAGSGASQASTTTTTAKPAPVSLTPTTAFDVEDMLTEAAPAPEPESNQDDPNRDEKANLAAEEQKVDDQASDEATPESEADADSEHEDEAPEVVEDQDGKRLVSAKHLERALKQRATAKTGEREALARAEAAEKQAAEFKAQLEASTEPVAAKETPLALLTKGMKVDLDNAESLEGLQEYADTWLKWCRRHPLGGAPQDGGEEWTPEQVVNQMEWAQSVLESLPKHQEFKTGFHTERAKVKAELPKLFQVGTDEQKAFAAEQRRVLNAATAKDQDHIIARQVLTKDIPLTKLAELAERYREERDGIASFARVPKKPSATTGGGNPEKPKPKLMTVTTRPVSSVKSGLEPGSQPKTLAQKLAAGPQDVEALFDAA